MGAGLIHIGWVPYFARWGSLFCATLRRRNERAKAIRGGDRVSAGVGVKPAYRRRDMVIHDLRRDGEPRGDLCVRETLGSERQQCNLPDRQLSGSTLVGGAWSA
jgi:hypothetical protein